MSFRGDFRAAMLAALLGFTPLGVSADIEEREQYHNAAQMEALIKDMVGRHRNIARLHVYGKSYQKRDLLVVEVTDFAAGKPDEKPGVLLVAGVQGDEPGGSEIAAQMLASLLERHGSDAATADLLKTRTLYFVPRLNPDGIERVFAKVPLLDRNTAEPLDDDNDDAQDEDGPVDVDGDGFILQMRIKNPEGEWRADPADKRLLVQRKPGERGEWRLFPFEGRDQDGDGRIAEDGAGGANLNRNFPALWDWRTKQPGAGPYMASAPETVALLDFLYGHINIALIESLHVTGAQPFYPASRLGAALAGQDKAILDTIGKKWEETTANKIPTAATDPKDPGAGTLLDWAYLHFGALAVSPEVWNVPKAAAPKDGEKPSEPAAPKDGAKPKDPAAPASPEKAWLDWNERELGGAGFTPWKAFKHPQLGDVEIGGWKPFTRDNPPPKYLAPLADKELAFFTAFAEMTPLVKIGDVKVTPKGGSVYEVLMSVTNAGVTPTANAQGILNRQTRPVLAILDLPPAVQLLSGIKRVKAGHLEAGETKTVSWTLLAPAGASVKLTANAQRGGVDTREVILR